MSDTPVRNTTHTQAPVNRHDGGADENQNASPLAAAYPNARVAAAHTPPRADAPQQATREQVAASLAEAVSRNAFFNKSGKADRKANNLLNMLPRRLQTPAALNNLEHAIRNDGKALTKLLHSAHDHYDDANKRLWFRSQIIQKLAEGATITETKEHADYLTARSNVVDSLKEVMKGQFLGVSAHAKARIIVDNLPDTAKTVGGMQRIYNLLASRREDVEKVFDLIKEYAPNRDRDKSIRAAMLSHLAEGHSWTEAKQYAENILIRPHAIEELKLMFGQDGRYPAGAARAEAIFERLPANLQTRSNILRMADGFEDQQSHIEDVIDRINDAWGDDETTYVSECADLVAAMVEAGALLEGPTRMNPATVVDNDLAFIHPEWKGTPESPVVLDFRGRGREEALTEAMQTLVEDGDVQPLKRGAGFLRAGSGFICCADIRGSAAVTIFWENNNRERRATLLNVSGNEAPNDLISAVKRSAARRYHDTDIRVQSINWLRVEPAGPMEADLARVNESRQAVYKAVARQLKAPLNITDRPHADQGLAGGDDASPPLLQVVVDVQNAKVFFTPEDAYR